MNGLKNGGGGKNQKRFFFLINGGPGLGPGMGPELGLGRKWDWDGTEARIRTDTRVTPD